MIITKKIEIEKEKYSNLNKILQITDKEFSDWVNEIIDKYLLLVEVKENGNTENSKESG